MQGEEPFLFDALFQTQADFIEQRILLPIDFPAGLVIDPPGFLPFRFQGAGGTLPFQLLRGVGASKQSSFVASLELDEPMV